MSLDNLRLQYIVTKYAMNGTYISTEDISTLLTYCTRLPPYSNRGGGESSQTTWQIFGQTETISTSCDIYNLVRTKSGEENMFFYDLFIKDTLTNKLYPVPIRVTNLLDAAGVATNVMYDPSGKTLCESTDVLVR